MKRVRIKFCGITRVEDARAAVALGVDAIGLVLTQKSPRYAGLERARDVRQSLPPFVSAVALFMDDEPGWIAEAVNALQPDLLQFHGNENAVECARFGCPYLKALAMGGGVDVHAALAAHPRALGFLLDGHVPGGQGGSGSVFDWKRVPADFPRPLILAGGLSCDNVGSAILAGRPYAVDVSSGIESAPGIKDAEKMRRFVEEVSRAHECSASQQ